MCHSSCLKEFLLGQVLTLSLEVYSCSISGGKSDHKTYPRPEGSSHRLGHALHGEQPRSLCLPPAVHWHPFQSHAAGLKMRWGTESVQVTGALPISVNASLLSSLCILEYGGTSFSKVQIIVYWIISKLMKWGRDWLLSAWSSRWFWFSVSI